MKYLIRVTLDVPVEMDDLWDGDPKFYFEENGCPGTGAVGTAIENAIKAAHKGSFCWACNMNGDNKIINVEAS
jgi:hypothetical protein